MENQKNKTWTIYKHTLKVEGPQYGWAYVGQTCQTNLKRRWHNGNGYLNNQRNAVFEQAILAYGWDSFDHEILEQDIDSKALADERERFWISFFHTYVGDKECRGFNSTKGGDSWGTLGKIKIYKPDTEEFMLINSSDLSDFEAIGWEKWYTPERKRWLRRKHYEEHRDEELEATKRNAAKRRAEKPKYTPKIIVELDRCNFNSDEEYNKAYLYEYGRLYRAANREKTNEYFARYRELNRNRINAQARDRYAKKKENSLEIYD